MQEKRREGVDVASDTVSNTEKKGSSNTGNTRICNSILSRKIRAISIQTFLQTGTNSSEENSFVKIAIECRKVYVCITGETVYEPCTAKLIHWNAALKSEYIFFVCISGANVDLESENCSSD